MLPKERKLHAADFKQMRGARSFSSTYFLLHCKNAGAAPSRFAVVTAAAVSSSAVVRNKIRRQIFAFLRSVLTECRDGYLVAIRVKKGAIGIPAVERRNEILALLKRAGILCGSAVVHFGNGG